MLLNDFIAKLEAKEEATIPTAVDLPGIVFFVPWGSIVDDPKLHKAAVIAYGKFGNIPVIGEVPTEDAPDKMEADFLVDELDELDEILEDANEPEETFSPEELEEDV